MATRRPLGALEEVIMDYLWAVDTPVKPAVVHQAVAPDLAYTTVMTVLTRLWEKGRLTRGRDGRAYTYQPVRSEAEHRAEGMQSALAEAQDRVAVLSSFVEALDTEDAKVLRKLLGRRP